jgi:hypothetical protein
MGVPTGDAPPPPGEGRGRKPEGEGDEFDGDIRVSTLSCIGRDGKPGERCEGAPGLGTRKFPVGLGLGLRTGESISASRNDGAGEGALDGTKY